MVSNVSRIYCLLAISLVETQTWGLLTRPGVHAAADSTGSSHTNAAANKTLGKQIA